MGRFKGGRYFANAEEQKFKWRTEADLCENAIRQFNDAGWVCHPETFEYDFIIVHPDGKRIGVEAKLKANIQVLAQAIGRWGNAVHHRAVLVPNGDGDFAQVAKRLGLAVISLPHPDYSLFWGSVGAMTPYDDPTKAKIWSEDVSGTLPEVPVDIRAGVPGPQKVTRWKVMAVTFCVKFRDRVFTGKEFKAEMKSDVSGWVQRGWVQHVGVAPGEKGRQVYTYRLADIDTRPDIHYPELTAALFPPQRIEA